jgi:8-oxo-dGTP diphosphatase
VRLYFCKVTDWVGQPVGREGQAFSWQYAPVDVGPLLPATIPVVAWLAEERPTP